VLEAVANGEKDAYEVCSGEDMLSRVHEANKKTLARRDEWMARRNVKIMTDCDNCGDRLPLVLGCDSCQPQYQRLVTTPTQEHDNQVDFWNKAAECTICGPRITARMENDCNRCGKAVSAMELERVLLGNDVVGLFPNIKSKNSGKIVRQKVEMSELEFEGFDYKQGADTL
jgi:hypothetical protein